MGLIRQIHGIDAKFAKALAEAQKGRLDVQDLLKNSPWSWARAELMHLFPPLKRHTEGLGSISLLELLRNFGYRSPTNVLAPFERSERVDMRIFRYSPQIFCSHYQTTRRLLLEYNGLREEQKPSWAKFFLYMCQVGRGVTLKELGEKGITVDKIADFISFFGKNVHVEKNKGANIYTFEKEFRDEIYPLLKLWLTPANYEVFNAWKQVYHFGKPEK